MASKIWQMKRRLITGYRDEVPLEQSAIERICNGEKLNDVIAMFKCSEMYNAFYDLSEYNLGALGNSLDKLNELKVSRVAVAAYSSYGSSTSSLHIIYTADDSRKKGIAFRRHNKDSEDSSNTRWWPLPPELVGENISYARNHLRQ